MNNLDNLFEAFFEKTKIDIKGKLKRLDDLVNSLENEVKRVTLYHNQIRKYFREPSFIESLKKEVIDIVKTQIKEELVFYAKLKNNASYLVKSSDEEE